MRKITAGLGLGLLFAVGCHWLPWKDKGYEPPGYNSTVRLTKASLLRSLNENARRVQAIQASIDLDCKAGDQSGAVSGNMVVQKPRNFRLKGSVLGSPAVDLGSNDREFWYWISRADPPYVYHCSYEDLARGVRVPFPFHPDLVVSALGLQEYDEAHPEKYVLKEKGNYLQLFEQVASPRGEGNLFKVTVLDKTRKSGNGYRVVAHLLVDPQGKMISRALVQDVTVTREGSVIPTRLHLTWPAEKVELKLKLYDPRPVALTAERVDHLFQRTDLTQSGLRAYDLARGFPSRFQETGRGGTRQATYLTTPRR